MRCGLGLMLVGALACAPRPTGSAEADPATPAVAGSGTPAPLEAEADSSASPESDSDGPAAPGPDPVRWIGKWRSDDVCLELFEHGDFELSLMGRGPKALVMGAARMPKTTASPLTLTLEVRRIWHARYTGRCRKVHELGKFVDEHYDLGLRFAPDETFTVTLRQLAEDQLELCGKTCVTLNRDVPVLRGRWRRPGLVNPRNPDPPLDPGGLAELDIDDNSGHVWVAMGPKSTATVYGSVTSTSTGADRFSVTIRPNGTTDQDAGTAISLWGQTLVKDQAVTLEARRLPQQRLEVCDEARHCTTLERKFDAFHHDLH